MTYEEAIKKIDFLIGGYQMLIDENIKYPKYCPWCGQALDWSE